MFSYIYASFLIEKHQTDIIHIHSGKLSGEAINVDNCVSIGKEQVREFAKWIPQNKTS